MKINIFIVHLIENIEKLKTLQEKGYINEYNLYLKKYIYNYFLYKPSCNNQNDLNNGQNDLNDVWEDSISCVDDWEDKDEYEDAYEYEYEEKYNKININELNFICENIFAMELCNSDHEYRYIKILDLEICWNVMEYGIHWDTQILINEKKYKINKSIVKLSDELQKYLQLETGKHEILSENTLHDIILHIVNYIVFANENDSDDLGYCFIFSY